MTTPSGPEAIRELEAATASFKQVISTNQPHVDVPGVGPTPSLAKRVDDAVEGNITRAETAANLAVDKSREASAFADKATEAAAKATQISGLDTVDQAIEARSPAIKNSVLEALSGGMLKNRLDANGNWSLFFVLPKFTNEMVNNTFGTNWAPASDVHPCFIRPDGTTMNSYEVGVYIASNDGKGNPVSVEAKDPYTSINFDTAKSKCKSMGSGYQLVSNAGWAALTIYALANQYQPTGNTYYGRSHSKQMQSGIRQDGGLPGDSNGTARTLTGTGPVAWRLLNNMFSPADMVGNVWEWVDGLKMVDGQLIVATNNDDNEENWVSQSAFLDAGNKLSGSKSASANTSVTWSQLAKDSSYVSNQLLQQLLIEPVNGSEVAEGRLYYNNDGERFPLRGGSWSNGSSAGLAALSLNNPRSHAYSNLGFRPAYFE